MAAVWYALSIKQPWAALLVHGIKTVEVRTWTTARRGRILIHAGKVPDPRPEAWTWVKTDQLKRTAELTGGVVGSADLIDCIPYPSTAKFEADRGRHLNPPDWFVPTGLRGFVFRGAEPVQFFPCPGNTFFFKVLGFA